MFFTDRFKSSDRTYLTVVELYYGSTDSRLKVDYLTTANTVVHTRSCFCVGTGLQTSPIFSAKDVMVLYCYGCPVRGVSLPDF